MSKEEQLLLKRNSFLEKELIAKNRELEIETSLETVRAKAVAMQSSADLKEVVKTLFEELRNLDVNLQACLIATFDPVTSDQRSWMIHWKTNEPYSFLIRCNEQPFYQEMLNAWKERNTNWSYMLEGEAKTKWEKFLFTDTDFKLLPKEVKEEMSKPKKVFFAASYYQYGAIQASSPELLSKASIDILLRFSKVFDSCYTRFLDLKKAESQARESQIQLALERVRARTMAMQKSDELSETVFVLFEQFKELGEHPDQATIGTINEDEKVIEYWVTMYGQPINKVFKFSIEEANVTGKIYKAWKEHKKSLVIDLSGKALSEFMEYRSGKGGAAINPDEKRRIINVAFFSKGLLNVQSNKERSKESIRLLERFASVFEQTYTRFLDLQKAEAQVRESQIQLALERVRAKTMAMQKPSEFVDVINIIGEQFIHLGFDFDWVNFSANGLDVSKAIDIYNFHVIPGLFQGATRVVIPFFEHPVFLQAEESVNEYQTSGNSFTVVLLGKKDKDTWLDHLFTNTLYKDLPDEAKTIQYNREVYQSSNVMLKDTWLSIGKYDVQPLTDEQIAILKRLANEFGQAYTRFLDLQKAEAQAREAQMEAALEKVRSRSLAMHKSDELKDVVAVVLEKLQEVGITMLKRSAIILEIEKGSKDFIQWVASPRQSSSLRLRTPYFDNIILSDFWKAKDRGISFYTKSYSFEEKNHFFKYFFNANTDTIPQEETKWILDCKHYNVSVAIEKNSATLIAIHSREVLSKEENEIVKRFARVFEQAYTRFLDLEKAEAQARETQIQLTLERVRARTMAMQKSDELAEVANLLFQQVQSLGLPLVSSGYNIWEKGDKVCTAWMSDQSGLINPSFKMPLTESPMVIRFYTSHESGESFYAEEVSGEALAANYRYLLTLPHFDKIIDGFLKAGFKLPTYQVNNVANFLHGNLIFITYKPVPEAHDIFKRFAKVFEQTYTRFLDLQKAEAQAREAEIELGLERVRSRAMAMQTSEELNALIGSVFTELTKLDLVLTRCVILIYEGNEKGVRWWMANSETPSTPMNFFVKYADLPFFNEYLKGWYNREFKWQYCLEGENKIKTDAFLFTETELSLLPDFVIEGMKAPDRIYLNASFNNFGNLTLATLEPLSEEHFNILLRFAKVFDLTYTRFNDLKQAEAQAREAQIELGLERVRARAMAMQKSDELAEAAQLLYDEFGKLGIKTFTCGYMFIDEPNNTQTAWVVLPDGTLLPNFIVFPLTGEHNLDDRYKSWKQKEALHVCDIQGEENKKHHEFLSRHVPASVTEDIFAHIPDRIIFYTANFSNGYLLILSTELFSPREEQTIIRFAKVFEQTYTRFLDLQKAEAQAREAQIEAALERVRSRSLAMHTSNELEDVIMVVSGQLQSLNFRFHNVSFARYNEINGLDFWLSSSGQPTPYLIHVPYLDNPMFNGPLEAIKKGIDFVADIITPKDNHEWIKHLLEKSILKKISEKDSDFLLNTEGYARSLVITKNIILVVGNYASVPYSDEQNFILKRFANVFDQAYTRFLDLQKAEAQAKESQIQLALERVRARTMAMQKSDELTDVAAILFKQVNELGIKPWTAGFNVWSDDNNFYTDYITSPQGGFIEPYTIDATRFPAFSEISDARKRGEEFYVSYLEGEMLKQTYLELAKFGDKQQYEKMLEGGFQFPTRQYNHFVFGQKASLIFITYEPVPEAHDIFKRFGKTFEQTYIRFLDLQKAEAQARESQIQLALERVRARTMAMHKSDELREVVAVIYEQLQQLGFVQEGSCNINIMDEITGNVDWWMTGFGNQKYPHRFHVEYIDHPTHKTQLADWKSGKKYTTIEVAGESKKEFDKLMLSQPDFEKMSEETKTMIASLDKVIFSLAFMKYGALSWAPNKLTYEQANIFQRFATVFEQTYTRFLDLEKAEAQAREAQIEAALERVRAKAMAMHNSTDVSVAASMVFSELRKLGIDPIRCGVGLLNKESRKAQLYSATSSSHGDSLALVGWVMLAGHPVLENIYDTWMKKEDYYPELTGTQLKSYYENLLAGLSLPTVPNSQTGEKQYGHFFSFSVGCLYTWSDRHYNESEIKILKRFAAIIDLTFRRYLDLQKAEAQAKEAEIEASMERLRAKAMAMQTSAGLNGLVQTMYAELKKLDESLNRCFIMIFDPETKDVSWWMAGNYNDQTNQGYLVPYSEHPPQLAYLKGWEQRQEKWQYIMQGKEKKAWDEYLFTLTELAELPAMVIQGMRSFEKIYLCASFSNFGCVTTGSEQPLSESAFDILLRFAKVFDLTYTRFNDLKRAEANTRDAIKQSALDRIRADIASMRTVTDLDRITPLIWNELIILGVPFIRCGVFIMDDDQQQIHTFLSTPEGKGIAAFHLPYNTPGNIAHVITHWQKKEIYTDHWDEEAFKDFADNLVQQGAMKSSEQYLSTMPAGGFNLHFVPFQQGMLYVGNIAPLGEEEISLLQSIADAFSTAYARYEDFNKLEAAKKQVDNTLTDLKQAQQQLVQSEKMASLGELTAGIAHEIQNPLNFVNNFSDVNSELIAEMEIELQNGNVEEAISIANDIKENEEKINHHGKRADAIVKGMLQHSRKSSGQKEETDINALADEYLRLSYHGLRAKDKNFNATIETDFDQSIEKINVIPQDVGRVLLNLFNNAFYAVNEQKNKNLISYEPKVSVTTKKSENRVCITVSDNGNGIPQKILDKIFQPFFTTKPTGQGTGLGLSLSYDIVKAHGGEIRVESKEGEGSIFIIQFPFV